jgi:hypothetical protein
MDQFALTLILSIKSDKDAEWLTSNLQTMGKQLGNNPAVDLSNSDLTHFARFVIIPKSAYQPAAFGRLVFTSNFDGDMQGYVKQLFEKGIAAAMEAFFLRCNEYLPGTATELNTLLQFYEKYNIPSQAFFAALPGATVQIINSSAVLRQQIDQWLDEGGALSGKPIPPNLAKYVNIAKKPEDRPKPPTSNLLSWLLNPLLNFVQWVIGIRSVSNNPQVNLKTEKDQYEMEDIVTQNPMTVIVPVKRNILAPLLLKMVLFVVSRQAKATRGSLVGLTSIHFARWVIIDNGKNILFESNFDGSWENYIDDFVDRASIGMNLIWGNCIGFPLAGCKDIESFKSYIRDNQSPVQVFYSAYKESTVRNVLTDLSLSEQVSILERPNGRYNFERGYYGA